MSKTSIIETKNVAIDTMAVTIQALHVNGKQMTLAVFRQLPKMDAYENDGRLKPLAWWGLVRYEVDGIRLWAVAGHNGVLYRVAITLPGWAYSADEKLQKAEDELAEYIKRGWNEDSDLIVKRRAIITELQKQFAKASIYGDSYHKLKSLPQLFIAV